MEGTQEVREVVGPDSICLRVGRAGLPPRIARNAAKIGVVTGQDREVGRELVRDAFDIRVELGVADEPPVSRQVSDHGLQLEVSIGDVVD